MFIYGTSTNAMTYIGYYIYVYISKILKICKKVYVLCDTCRIGNIFVYTVDGKCIAEWIVLTTVYVFILDMSNTWG